MAAKGVGLDERGHGSKVSLRGRGWSQVGRGHGLSSRW